MPKSADVVVLTPAGASGPPDPPRPLAAAGRTLWERAWRYGHPWLAETDVELLLLVCELMDERTQLRIRVLRSNDWRDRAGLRALGHEITDGLAALGFTPEARTRLALGEVQVADALQRFREQAAALRRQHPAP